MKKSFWCAIALLGSFALGCGQGATNEPDDVDTLTDELIGAPLDPGHRFAVGVCTGPLQADGACPPPGTPNTVRCTGTLVAPDLVLTARHCTERIGPPADEADFCSAEFNGVQINAQMQITTDSTVFKPGATWYTVQSVEKPATANNCTDDLVLLRLATKVKNVQPVGIDLFTSVSEYPSDAFAIVGRGAILERYDTVTHERIEYDTGNFERRKREEIPFICAPETVGECTVVDYWSDPPTFDPVPGQFAYEPATAPGDSGSGVYRQEFFENGFYLVAGVHTLGVMGPDGYSSGGISVRVDQHATFIRAVAKSAAKAGGYPVPWWAL